MALITAGVAAAAGAYAAPSPDASTARTALAQNLAPALGRSQAQGAVPGTQRLSVAVSLKLRDSAALDQLITAVSTPGSADYGHYLTPAQFNARFAPAQADIDRVRAYLRDQGLTVTAVSANSQVIDATGPSSVVESAFGTQEVNYYDAALKRHFYANTSTPTLPADVASAVQGVSGLDNHTVLHPDLAGGAVTPHATPSGFGPSQYDAAYRLNQVGADGTGQTVALWEFDGYKASDLTTYNTQFGLTGPAAATVSVDGANYDSRPGDGQVEVELDSEIVRGVAPKATQLVYEAPNSDQGEIDMAAKIVSDNRASVISISWGGCERDTTSSVRTAVDNSFRQAAAQGISIYSASGDDGSRDCAGSSTKAVDYPASSPYDTGVGGTTLTLSGGAYGSERAWSDSGGGVSTVYAKPSWQTGSGTMRSVPDVSSNADYPGSPFAVYTTGGWTVVGGTSAAAPLWSGFSALYNQKAQAAGKAHLGEANPALYRIASGSGYAAAFHDITAGSNQDYSTATGYDPVTGVGSPIADGLTTALLGGTTGGGGGNTVTVTNPGSKTGTVGTATSLQVSATDSASGQTLSYSATGLPPGLSISATSGLISGTPTTAGTYTVTVTAKDTTGASGSAAFTWTVTGTGGGGGCTASGQKLGNPGFETGTASPWTASTGVVDNSTDEAAHSGSWKAWLDGYGSTHTDTLSQAVAVPAGCSATFTFFLHIDTAESGSTAYDKLTVKANGTTLATYSNANAATGFVQKSFDLSSFAGQTVTVAFSGTEDSSLQTSFVVDDTALTAS
ncbi:MULTISPECIES: protease pro-enzyme activation domain-containing protein [unclassified Streptomyces]|uniref:protease pro-enzyme activation domain-containing protein n=1 Tax=unclassified Streptomyces TaxID=2593676 RepID=UPI001EED527B|nr:MULTISPECIES: protease pro-enzyme activation domain-containing protein [unclassified Streptomyces]